MLSLKSYDVSGYESVAEGVAREMVDYAVSHNVDISRHVASAVYSPELSDRECERLAITTVFSYSEIRSAFRRISK